MNARILNLLSLSIASALVLAGCSKRTGAVSEDDNRDHDHSHSDTVAKNSSTTELCAEHGVPEDECGICHPERAATLRAGEGSKVRLPSNDSAKLVGVELGRAQVGAISEAIECYAEFEFDQNSLAQISAPVGGIIQEVAVDLGSRVGENQTVAKIWSAAIAEAVAKAVLTHQVLERERKLRGERITAQKELEEAEAAHRTACQQARTLGFSEEDIEHMRGTPNESVMLEIRAPFAGEIIERSAVRGSLVEAGKALFTLADRSTMWAMLKIPESVLSRVRVGQTVELRAESFNNQTFTGTLTWISAQVDEQSRMAQARVEVPNPDGLLKAKMFARARILTRSAGSAVLAPASALCSLEGKPFVFVKLADDLFEARAIDIGAKFNDQMEVLAGLNGDEQIVVNHGFALKSHWLSSRMGTGCAD